MTEAARETLSMTEAAAMLGLHRDTAYRLAKRGEFPVPVIRLGSVLRVSRRQLEAFINPGVTVATDIAIDGKQLAADVAAGRKDDA